MSNTNGTPMESLAMRFLDTYADDFEMREYIRNLADPTFVDAVPAAIMERTSTRSQSSWSLTVWAIAELADAVATYRHHADDVRLADAIATFAERRLEIATTPGLSHDPALSQ